MKRISILILAACLTVEIGVAQAMTLSYGPMVSTTASGGDDGVHVVQSGQTLYSIARLYGTTTEELQRLNGMESTALLVGQKIKVPASTSQKETVSDDSKAGERTMPDENTEKIMVPRSIYEKVLPCETITTFAKRVGTTVDFIKEKNGVNSVKAGEKMIVKEEMVAIVGERKKPTPKKTEDTEARDLGDLDAMLSAVDDEAEAKPTVSTETEKEEEVTSTETEEERVTPETEEIQEKATVEFVNPSMVLGNTIETVTFVQKDAKLKQRYYIFHKTLPKGTKVKIHIPDNAGYVMAEVVGKLEAESTSGIALSPACVRIVGGTSLKKVTFSY